MPEPSQIRAAISERQTNKDLMIRLSLNPGSSLDAIQIERNVGLSHEKEHVLFTLKAMSSYGHRIVMATLDVWL